MHEQTALIDELLYDCYHNNHFVIITNATPTNNTHKEMKELHLVLFVLLLVRLVHVYGQEPTNRPSNGK